MRSLKKAAANRGHSSTCICPGDHLLMCRFGHPRALTPGLPPGLAEGITAWIPTQRLAAERLAAERLAGRLRRRSAPLGSARCRIAGAIWCM